MQLTAAYRSLSRPSSAPNAKAFSIYSSSLELPLVNLHFRVWFTLVLRFFSRLNCCVYHTCSLQDLVFIFVWQNCLIFTLTEKPDFNLIDFLVSLYFCLSCMSHRFFLKNLYDFSYSVFNEHSLNFRQGHLAFTKLLRYLNLFKYLRRSVISPKELFSFFLGSSGLEPPTSRLSGARSNQLSYEPLSHTLFRRLRTSFPSVGCLRLQLHSAVDCLSGPPDWR